MNIITANRLPSKLDNQPGILIELNGAVSIWAGLSNENQFLGLRELLSLNPNEVDAAG